MIAVLYKSYVVLTYVHFNIAIQLYILMEKNIGNNIEISSLLNKLDDNSCVMIAVLYKSYVVLTYVHFNIAIQLYILMEKNVGNNIEISSLTTIQ